MKFILAILLALLSATAGAKARFLAYGSAGDIAYVTLAKYNQGWKTPQWVSKGFPTIASLTEFLNTLPLPVARDAKILVINSQRSFLGVLSDPYFLIYRDPR